MVSKQCPTHWWGHTCHEPCRRGVQSGLECGGISHWLVMVYTFAILHAIVFAWYLLILGTNVGYIVSDVSLHEFYDLNYYFLNSELNFKKGVLSWEWSWFTILSKKSRFVHWACLPDSDNVWVWFILIQRTRGSTLGEVSEMGVLLYFNFFKFTVIIELIHSGSSRDIFRHTLTQTWTFVNLWLDYITYTIGQSLAPIHHLKICQSVILC